MLGNCCCFSREQKLAWARENGVTPPACLPAHTDDEHEHDGPEHAEHENDASTVHNDRQPAAACCSHRVKCDAKPIARAAAKNDQRGRRGPARVSLPGRLSLVAGTGSNGSSAATLDLGDADQVPGAWISAWRWRTGLHPAGGRIASSQILIVPISSAPSHS